jgi:hypothetical protein
MISIGVDLGKARDYTAIAVVVRTETTIHNVTREGLHSRTEREYGSAELIHMERLKAGTSFIEAVKRIREMATHPGFGPGRKRLVVDATGLGSPVVEMIREHFFNAHNAVPSGRLCAPVDCELRPVVITGGSGQRCSGGEWHVAKADLMTGLRTSMELQDLLIAGRMPETPELVKELTSFGGTGHDDRVMALALAVWGVRLLKVGSSRQWRIL